jgi:toxin HigB-1
MIKSFKDRRLKRLYQRGDRSKIAPDMADKIENILAVLDRARRLQAMDLPGFRLHALKGDLAGHWSVTVRANWRVIFRFEDGDALDVALIDYH